MIIMCRKLLLSIICMWIPASIVAQDEVVFSANQLQEMAQRYSGNSFNWPIVVKLADHNIGTNTFLLSPADIRQLRSFSAISLQYEEQQDRMKDLIANGATIFAKERLIETNRIFSAYLQAVKNGEIQQALQIGSSLKDQVDTLETELNANRMVHVQAQLSKKSGTVDKRKGLLASWTEAFKGDLFQESDGIRTGQESYATLTFTDGSNIIVNPVTTAVIRKSRIDKLDESSDTEITLVEGGLLSKLSATGREKSNYILNAGASTTELKTQNFFAENSAADEVKLTNYDGKANVRVNDVTVTINRNEGTIVKGNNPPLPPIQLLPAPSYVSPKRDTIIYSDELLLIFEPVEKAEKYLIQTSSSYDFEQDIKELTVTRPRAILRELPLGTTYVKVLSVDSLGLRGPYSKALRIIRNVDTQAPPIFGEQLANSILFTTSDHITINGVTEPDALVRIDGTEVKVSKLGSFSSEVKLQGIDQNIEITATDNSGNQSSKVIRLIHLTEHVLFNLTINGTSLGAEIQSSESPLTIRGVAYPGLEVEINNNGSLRKVKTDIKGRWGLTMDMQQGELSITFRGAHNGVKYMTKSFTVK